MGKITKKDIRIVLSDNTIPETIVILGYEV